MENGLYAVDEGGGSGRLADARFSLSDKYSQ